MDPKARCIIYKNIHDEDLKRLVGLKHAKKMSENIENIFGDGTSRNIENEKKRNKKKNKKKSLQNQESQPQESHSSSAHDLTDNEKRSENHEPKGININDFLVSYNFDDSDLDHVETHSEYEDNGKVIRDGVSILTTACKDQEK